MLENLIPLLESWTPVFTNYIIYYLAGSFLIFVACFIHSLVRR